MGSIGLNSTISEQDQVAYQIKRNNECSNIIANILPTDAQPPPPPPLRKGLQVNIQLFQNTVMMHIKFTGITKCNHLIANVLPTGPHPSLRGWGQKVRIQLFQNMFILHIKFIGTKK